MPLRRLSVCVLSKDSFRRRSPLGTKLPRFALGPPSLFLTTSTVYPASHRAGLFRPATGHGVRHVSGGRRLALGAVANDCIHCLRAGHRSLWRQTLRSFPLDSSSCRVTATDALPSLSSASALPPDDACAEAWLYLCGRVDLRALFRCRVRCEHSGANAAVLPDAPLGFPSEVVVAWRLTWTCGCRPWLRRLHSLPKTLPKEVLVGWSTSPGGRLVSSRSSPPRSRRSCGVVERASTGLAEL